MAGLLHCTLRALPSQLLVLDFLFQNGAIIYIRELLIAFSAKRAVGSEAQPNGMAIRRCDDCVTRPAGTLVSLKRDSDVSRIIAEDT